MGRFIHFLKLFERGMRIYFRRGEPAVAQKFLHALYARPVVQHGRGKSVPQHMRAAFFKVHTDERRLIISRRTL